MIKLHIILLSFLTLMPSLFADNFPVEFIRISDSIIIHRSYELYSDIKTPSNGLIIIGDKSVVVVDTAWNNQETEQILEYINVAIKKKIVACIITHSHQDRAGGLTVIQNKDIPIYMTDETNKLLSQKYIYNKIKFGVNRFDSVIIEIEYFGPAHSPDNIVLYYPKEKVLFGGCIVKSLNSTTIGNITDSDLLNWPIVITKLKLKYSDTKIVIPGHGDLGGYELLEHTFELVK
jgi:metallo-beta-lactamase class B